MGKSSMKSISFFLQFSLVEKLKILFISSKRWLCIKLNLCRQRQISLQNKLREHHSMEQILLFVRWKKQNTREDQHFHTSVFSVTWSEFLFLLRLPEKFSAFFHLSFCAKIFFLFFEMSFFYTLIRLFNPICFNSKWKFFIFPWDFRSDWKKFSIENGQIFTLKSRFFRFLPQFESSNEFRWIVKKILHFFLSF